MTITKAWDNGTIRPMQAKDVQSAAVLDLLSQNPRATCLTNADGTLFENSVQHAMPARTPHKVALAKMKSLIRSGLVDGCACGCRGDFEITQAGRDALAKGRA